MTETSEQFSTGYYDRLWKRALEEKVTPAETSEPTGPFDVTASSKFAPPNLASTVHGSIEATDLADCFWIIAIVSAKEFAGDNQDLSVEIARKHPVSWRSEPTRK
jgi:hypothetical protein